MDDTAPAAATAAAAAAPAIDDPLAANDPNPAYLAALAGALELAGEARVAELARAVANPKREDLVSALLCHELASCHRLMMRFGAMADCYLSHTSPTVDAEQRQVGRDAIGFAAIAARLMARYQQAALALPKLRSDVDAVQKRIVVDWGFDDCDCRAKGGKDGNGGGTGGGGNPGAASGSPPSTPPAGTPAPSAAAAAPQASAPRRGQLKNGNPSGDYLAAPRCGATTRAGCACRQPAMQNSRCRLHGGKSTGARTAAVIGARSAAAAVSRRLAWMADLARACAPEHAPAPGSTPASARGSELSAGHGVHRSDSASPLGDADAAADLTGGRRRTEVPGAVPTSPPAPAASARPGAAAAGRGS